MAYLGRPAPQFLFDAFAKNSFSGDGSTTAFTLTKSPASVNSLLVLVNNVIQEPATAFNLSDTTLTFTSAPPSGSDNIYACFWGGTLGITTAVKLDTSNVAAITGNLTPASNVAFSLGQPASAWKELWLDGNSLHLGNTSISIGKTGEVEFMKTNKLGQPVTSVDVANTTLSSGDVLSFYSANTTGNVRFARGVAIGYANSKVPGANLDVKGNTFISGVTTASTFEPTGDTSAGDDAAIGYTAAEGLILTGQGSTNDVTIKNDADADVITIPTGTTAATFAGNMRMTKGGDIASASPLVIDTDGNYFDVTGTTSFAAMTVAAGNYFMLQFDGALTITHGSGIELPGAANLTTAAGDRLICYATAADTVEVMNVATEAAASSGGFTLATPQTPTSGTTLTLSGIPSGSTMVVINLSNLTFSGGTSLDIQLGDSGGIETSGYLSAAGNLSLTSSGVQDGSSEWIFHDLSTSDGWNGHMILTLTDSSNNLWTCWGGAKKGSESMALTAGSKTLSSELTQIIFKSRDGSATFASGTINLMYQ